MVAVGAAGALLVPFGFWSVWLRTPESRKDDVLAVAAAVRERAGPGDAVLFMPSSRREWLLSSPGVYRGLRDVALERSPAASHSLQGTELPPERIRAALLAPPRVIAPLDPAGQPLDPYPGEAAKREDARRPFRAVLDDRGARRPGLRLRPPGRLPLTFFFFPGLRSRGGPRRRTG